MPSDHRRRRDRDREALLQAALPQRPRLREHQRRRDRAAGEELRVEVEVDRPWQVRPHRLRPPGDLTLFCLFFVCLFVCDLTNSGLEVH